MKKKKKIFNLFENIKKKKKKKYCKIIHEQMCWFLK